MSESRSDSEKRRRSGFRYLFSASVLLCVLGFFSLFAFTHQFIYAPTTPDQTSGKVIAWNNHGTHHYITAREDLIKDALIAFCVATFLCAAIFGYFDQRQK